MTRTEHWPDIGYTCIAEHLVVAGGEPPLIVNWKVYLAEPGPFDKEHVIISGQTKWDSCTDFNVSSKHTFHACDRQGLLALCTLLTRVHDLAGHMLPDTRDFTPEPLP